MENDWNSEIEKMLQADAEKQRQEVLHHQQEMIEQAKRDIEKADKEKSYENYCAHIFESYGVTRLLQEVLDQVWQRGEIVTTYDITREYPWSEFGKVRYSQSLICPFITERAVFTERSTMDIGDRSIEIYNYIYRKALIEAMSFLKISMITDCLDQNPEHLKFEIEGGISAPKHYLNLTSRSEFEYKEVTKAFSEQFIFEKFTSDQENFQATIKPFIIREGMLRRQKGFIPIDLRPVPAPILPEKPEILVKSENFQASQKGALIDSIVKRWKRFTGNV